MGWGRPLGEHSAARDCAEAGAESQAHPRKVFVGGLAHKTTTGHLRDHFQRFGAVSDTVVLRWTDGRSRGFGYVTFEEADSVNRALATRHIIAGRQVDVKRAVPGTNKLFVGGLPQNSAAAELRSYFERFGVVSDAVVMMDPMTNRSRGFGFVCFLPGDDGAAAVAAALAQYDRHQLRGKWIEVKSAAPPHKLMAAPAPPQPPWPLPTPGTEDWQPALCRRQAAAAVRTPLPPSAPRTSCWLAGSGDSTPLASPRKVELPCTVPSPRSASTRSPPSSGSPASACTAADGEVEELDEDLWGNLSGARPQSFPVAGPNASAEFLTAALLGEGLLAALHPWPVAVAGAAGPTAPWGAKASWANAAAAAEPGTWPWCGGQVSAAAAGLSPAPPWAGQGQGERGWQLYAGGVV